MKSHMSKYMKTSPLLFSVAALLYISISTAFAQLPSATNSGDNQNNTPSLPAFGPYKGDTGYQEIQLSGDAWYLAYHGNGQTSDRWVNASWAARAAQLCVEKHFPYYVEMRYVTEAIFRDEKIGLMYDNEIFPFMHKATVIYIPIIIPSRSSQAYSPVITPSKLAPFKCVGQPDMLIDASRAINVKASAEEAKLLGIKIQ